jgi:HEAT repeat protein
VLVRGALWKNPGAGPGEAAPQPQVVPSPDVGGLLQRLRHKEPTERRSAAEILGRLGPKADGAVSGLLHAAVDVDATVRQAASMALDRVDPAWWKNAGSADAVPGLVAALGSHFTEVRQAASHLLTRIGQPAVAELIRALADKEQDTRQVMVARTLGRLGADAAAAVPALARELNGEFAHVRQAAAEALGEVGPAAEPATPSLVLALTDWQPAVRQCAARCLACVGRPAGLAIPALVQLLADRDNDVRGAAVEALARIGAEAVPSLIEIARARDSQRVEEWLKWRVEVSDWYSRPIDEDFQREPLKALRNATWYFRHAIDDHARVEQIHEAALRALAKMGPTAADAVPVLEEALADPNQNVRVAAVRALSQIGPPASPTVPALLHLLVDRAKPVRQAVAEALGKIDANWAADARVGSPMASFVELLKRTGEEGQMAVDAFAVIGAPSVPALVEALAAGDRVLREAAATALGRIGPGARAAIPALVKATQDSHGWVREAAVGALKMVDPSGVAGA